MPKYKVCIQREYSIGRVFDVNADPVNDAIKQAYQKSKTDRGGWWKRALAAEAPKESVAWIDGGDEDA